MDFYTNSLSLVSKRTTMNLKTILILVVTALWFWFCHFWQCCWIQQACYDCATTVENGTVTASAPVFPPPERPAWVAPTRKALDFKWSQAIPYTNKGFSNFRHGLLDHLGEDKILEITGQYFAAERQPKGFENMGMARAAKVKELFKIRLDSNRIQIKGKLLETEPEGVREGYFEAIRFRYLAPTLEKTNKDRAIIRFPYNSIQKEIDQSVDDYLAELAKRIRKTKEQVLIVGHTDDQGTTTYNEKLGLRRAKEIRAILMKKGVPRKQVTVNSKGERKPLVPNDSEENRHQNRRTEVIVIGS